MSYFASHDTMFYEDLDEIYIGDRLFHKGNDITDEEGFYWYAFDDYDGRIVVTRQEMQGYLSDSMVDDSIDDIPVFQPTDLLAAIL